MLRLISSENARSQGPAVKTSVILLALDQAISGASNALPLLVVAHYSGVGALGVVALMYSGIPFFLGLGRSIISESRMAAQWTELQSRRAMLPLLLASATVPSGVCFVILGYSEWPSLLLLSAVLPVILIQDYLRNLCFSEFRPGCALISDLSWMGSALTLQGLVVVHGSGDLSRSLFHCYLAGALIGLIVMVLARPFGRRQWASKAPIVVPSRGSLVGQNLRLLVVVNSGAGLVSFFGGSVILVLASKEILGYVQNGQLLTLPLSLLATTLTPLVLPRLSAQSSLPNLRRWMTSLLLVSLSTGGAILLVVSLGGGQLFPKSEHEVLTLSAVSAIVAAILTVLSVLNYVILRRFQIGYYVTCRAVWLISTLAFLPIGAATSTLAGVWLAVILAALTELIVSTLLVRRVANGNGIRESALDSF